jgi:hypothetical protein
VDCRTPSTNIQASEKFQTPNSNQTQPPAFYNSKFGVSLEVGI